MLRAVECIPAGAVSSYGVIGRATGTGARFAARVMAVHGSAVCWWRVVSVSGRLPAPLAARALPHWAEESTPLVSGADPARVDMASAAVAEAHFSAAVAAACADLG